MEGKELTDYYYAGAWKLYGSLKVAHDAHERGRILKDHDDRIRAEARAEAAVKLNRLIEALTPSAETKSAYIGEFPFSITDVDGNEVMRVVNVPWTTVKEIMAAIRKRAAILSDEPKEREAEAER